MTIKKLSNFMFDHFNEPSQRIVTSTTNDFVFAIFERAHGSHYRISDLSKIKSHTHWWQWQLRVRVGGSYLQTL